MTTPLDVAARYIGYTEYPPNSNQTLFGADFGMNGVPWCMQFVQFCFKHSDPAHPLPYKTASCSALLDWYKAYEPNKIKVMPLPNDIVIYKFGHTGIVDSGNSQAVTAIEGNTSAPSDKNGSQDNGGGVYRRVRPASQVAAYIRPFDTYKDDDYMTRKEILDEIGDEWIERFDQLPKWAKPDIRELLDRQIINGGTDYDKDPDDINMFLSDIKTIIAVKRMIGYK
ncbi:MAG: CHAP domain-containing protein [Clostridia bacterium]|nr:CHAP domain-containing protein [Clostridia bacterium]